MEIFKRVIDNDTNSSFYVRHHKPSLLKIKNHISVKGTYIIEDIEFHDPSFLQYAIIAKKHKSLKTFLHYCGDRDTKDDGSSLGMDLIEIYFPTHSNTKKPLIHLAIFNKDLEAVKILVDYLKEYGEKYGNDIEALKTKENQNRYIFRFKDDKDSDQKEELFKKILRRPDFNGVDILSAAIISKDEDIIKYLISAEINADPLYDYSTYYPGSKIKAMLPIVMALNECPNLAMVMCEYYKKNKNKSKLQKKKSKLQKKKSNLQKNKSKLKEIKDKLEELNFDSDFIISGNPNKSEKLIELLNGDGKSVFLRYLKRKGNQKMIIDENPIKPDSVYVPVPEPKPKPVQVSNNRMCHFSDCDQMAAGKCSHCGLTFCEEHLNDHDC